MNCMNYIFKSINRKKVYSMLLFLFCQLELFSQSFNMVGCKAPYETLSIGAYNNELIYSRGGDSMCGVLINGVGKWNRLTWDNFGIGIDQNDGGGFLSSISFKNELYLGGHFYTIGGKTTNKIARWNGIQWDSVGKGLDAQGNLEKITAMTVYKNELYVAGLFRQVDGVTGYNHIAVWNGTSWRKIGGLFGSLPEVYCMAVYKNELYVGGLFTQAGFTPANFIARWDGQQWRRVGKGTSSIVQSMVVDTVNDILYVAGDFRYVNDTIKCKVAQWDGNNWEAVGNPTIFPSSVLSMEMYHGYLYAAGISYNGLVTDTCLARWDGNAWEPILGPSSTITCLKTYKDELYLGGSFKMINNDSIPYLARYYSPDSVVAGIVFTSNKNNKLEVYPNPVENTLIIKSDLIFEKYLVYSLDGKLVLEITRPTSKSIDFVKLTKGEFILKAYPKNSNVYIARFRKE